jgi:hypothetical protein
LPGSTFYDIDQVKSGEDNVWDYTAFNKVGTTFPAVMEVFFATYDVVFTGYEKYVSLPVMRWGHARFLVRDENCDSQEDSSQDSPGLDCSSTPPGMMNVGPSLDAALPSPIYISVGDFQASLEPQVKISKSRDTRDPGGFDNFIHTNVGVRVAHSSSYTISVRLQKNTIFKNDDMLLPISCIREYFSLGQFPLMRLLQYDYILSFTCSEVLLTALILQNSCNLLFILYGCRRMSQWSKLNDEEPLADTFCQ